MKGLTTVMSVHGGGGRCLRGTEFIKHTVINTLVVFDFVTRVNPQSTRLNMTYLNTISYSVSLQWNVLVSLFCKLLQLLLYNLLTDRVSTPDLQYSLDTKSENFFIGKFIKDTVPLFWESILFNFL